MEESEEKGPPTEILESCDPSPMKNPPWILEIPTIELTVREGICVAFRIFHCCVEVFA
jgi:hypothetical protein